MVRWFCKECGRVRETKFSFIRLGWILMFRLIYLMETLYEMRVLVVKHWILFWYEVYEKWDKSRDICNGYKFNRLIDVMILNSRNAVGRIYCKPCAVNLLPLLLVNLSQRLKHKVTILFFKEWNYFFQHKYISLFLLYLMNKIHCNVWYLIEHNICAELSHRLMCSSHCSWVKFA